jgi:sialidase-1
MRSNPLGACGRVGPRIRAAAVLAAACTLALAQEGNVTKSNDDVMRLKLLPPGPDNPRNSEGDFIQLKDGRLLFVYTHFTGKEGNDESPCYLTGRYSGDGGKTWTTNDVLVIPNDESRTHNIMSVSLLRLPDGRIALFYLCKHEGMDCRPIMRVSTDEARTWIAPQVCIGDAERGYYVLNNDRVVQLKSGRLIMPVARHDDRIKPDQFNHTPRTMCYLSDDNGATWRRSKTVLNELGDLRVALQEPGVIELKDGRLMMFCRTHTGHVYRSLSADGGDTWTPAEPYPGVYAPVSVPAIERIPKTGDLLMAWNNHAAIATNAASPYHGKRTPYNVAISRDEGETWEHIKTLEDDVDGWYCYTAIEFVGDDVLLAHCAGNRPKDGGLAVTQITRFPLAWLYAGAPAAGAAPAFAPGRRVKIFVLTGQSNSLGTTGDPKETDITPGKDPLDEHIPFFWANRSTRAGDGPAVQYGDSGGKIVTLRAQQGEGVDPLFWGPEIGFGRTLAAAGVTNFLIIKASRGGGGNGYWLKGNSDDHMYRHVVATVRQAVQALPPGTDFEVSALLYVQGESDSAAEAALSGERLRSLAANLRKDLPNAAGMRVLIGGIALGGKSQDLVRAQQSALPAADPMFRYIDTLDLKSQRYDNLHFSKPAKLELGRRMARAWLAWK